MAVGPIALGRFYDLMKPSGAFLAAAVVLCMGIGAFVVSIKRIGSIYPGKGTGAG
jgi:hypothetical protein